MRLDCNVLDAQGRLVRSLANRWFEPGDHSIIWDAGERDLPSGVYYIELTGTGVARREKMVFLE